MKRSQVNNVCCKQKVQKHVLNTLKWLKPLIYTWVLTKNTQGTTVINIVCNTPVWVQNVNNSWQKINSLKLFQSLQQIRIESTCIWCNHHIYLAVIYCWKEGFSPGLSKGDINVYSGWQSGEGLPTKRTCFSHAFFILNNGSKFKIRDFRTWKTLWQNRSLDHGHAPFLST